jgi:mannose-6-phosphate isomerase-like protein (cupin superfamily)
MNNATIRPWGSYEELYVSESYKVKRIVVNPNQSFSLQYHNNRDEVWTIVEGNGTVRNGEFVGQCTPGDIFNIPAKQIHRVTSGNFGLVFIEVQRGCCNEEDIVRLEDDYGRT